MTRFVSIGSLAVVIPGIGTAGRAAGARHGDWSVRVATVGDIRDEAILVEQAQTLSLARSVQSERYLLEPDDVVVAARTAGPRVALVPALTTDTMADASLLVVKTGRAEPGLGPYLWWLLASARGRAAIAERMTGSSLLMLKASDLADLRVPLPPADTLLRLGDLALATEDAYRAALDAARLRRTIFRDHIAAGLFDAAAGTDAHSVRPNGEGNG